MSSVTDPRTARARILDVTLGLYGERGPSAVSMRDIAAAAGVSAALVVHHFGSKDGLREAVDAEVVHLLGELTETLGPQAAGGAGSPTEAFIRALAARPDVLAYLARAMVENDAFSAALVDSMVAGTQAYLAQATAAGQVVPADDERMRAVLVTFHDLGVLILREHVSRLTGADPLTPEGGERWIRAAMQLYAEGLFR